jgi:hypothetical protein
MRLVLFGVLLCGMSGRLLAQYRERFPLPASAVPAALGVNIHFTDPQPGELEQIHAAGFRWVRMDFFWHQIEREKGKYDFAPYDRLMAALEKQGIRPIFILDYGNGLYEQGPPTKPESRAAFTRFVAAAMERFKNRGIVWEMWNEPNLAQFWQPRPNPGDYIALATEVGKTIRRIAPNEWYIGPATSGVDLAFLERCFQGGLLRYWDAVSVHPYRTVEPETVLPEYQKLRTLIARYAPKGKTIPLLNGEWGYSEKYPGLNLDKQSKFLPRQILTSLAAGLKINIWYDWRDDGTDPNEIEHHFGTIYNDGQPKPTYRAAQTLARILDGFQFHRRLRLDSPNDHCLVFSKGTEVRLVAWTTERAPHEARIPASPGRVRVVDYLGIETQAIAEPEAIRYALPNPPLPSASVGQRKQTEQKHSARIALLKRHSASVTTSGLRLILTDAPRYLIAEGENALWARMASAPTLPAEISQVDALTRHLETFKQQAPLCRLVVEGRTNPYSDLSPRLPGALEYILGQGEWEALTFRRGEADAGRGETPVALRATFLFGKEGAFQQELHFRAPHPLRVTLLPRLADRLPVQIQNRSDRAFEGQVRLTVNGTALTKQARVSGNQEAMVYFDLPKDAGGRYSARVTLVERRYVALKTPLLTFVMLEDFGQFVERAPLSGDYVVLPDGDSKVKSEIQTEVAPPPPGLPGSGGKAVQIAYDFAPGWKFLRFAVQGKAAETLTDTPSALGMWIHGDGSGDMLRARFVDSTGQTFQPDYGPIDWKGWRFVTFSLRGEGGRWGGADDGIVHYPIRLDSPLLIDSPGGRGGKGKVYVTGLTLIYGQYP